jgi:hypothetical protein
MISPQVVQGVSVAVGWQLAAQQGDGGDEEVLHSGLDYHLAVGGAADATLYASQLKVKEVQVCFTNPKSTSSRLQSEWDDLWVGWAGEVGHHPAGGEAAVCLVGAAHPCVGGVVYALVPQAGHHAVGLANVVGWLPELVFEGNKRNEKKPKKKQIFYFNKSLQRLI